MKKYLEEFQGIQTRMMNLRNGIKCQIESENGSVAIEVSYWSEHLFVYCKEWVYCFLSDKENRKRIDQFKMKVKRDLGVVI